MAKSVIGLFNNHSDAQSAMQDLEAAGFSHSNITHVDSSTGSSQLSSTLVNAGIPEQDARIYADGVQQGNHLIMLQAIPDNDAERAADILDRHNIIDISGRSANYQRMSMDRTSTSTDNAYANLYQGGETVIPIIEEELRVGKRQVERGGVRVNTHVEEVPVNEQVTLREETIDVHRRPVDRAVTDADATAFREGTFEVRETDEEAIVDKQARVVEEVHVKKNVEERTENIQDTVRRTDVDVEEVGGTTRTVGSTDTTYTDTDTNRSSGEGLGSRLSNAAERLTGKDVDRDGDVNNRNRNNY